jgi:hypothetical protein
METFFLLSQPYERNKDKRVVASPTLEKGSLIVIASGAKQSRVSRTNSPGLPRRCAPRNDESLQDLTWRLGVLAFPS